MQWRAQDLAPNLERWLDGNKGHEFLLPRSLLDPALRWLHDYPDELAGPAAGYIQASKRRRTRRRSLISGAVAVLVVASLTAAGIFYSLQQTAVQRQNVAVSRLLIIESETLGDTDPVTSKLLSVAAWRIDPSSDARYAMLAAATRPGIAVLTGHASPVNAVAFSPDGRPWPAGSDDGAVRLWDVATRRQIGGPLTGLGDARSRGGVQPGRHDPGQPAATTARCGCGTWPPAGRSAAPSPPRRSASTRWRSARTARPWPPAATLARCGCGTWPPAGQIGGPLTGPPASARSDAVAFSRDGTTLAAGSGDGAVRLWDVATRRQIGGPLTGHAGPVDAVAFEPGRHDPGHRRRRRHGAAVGRGHPPADRRPAHRPRRRRSTVGGVQPGRHDPGQPAAPMARCGCGTWPPTGRSAHPLTGPDTAWSTRWRSARTARPWPAGGDDGTVRLWDVATRRQIAAPSPAASDARSAQWRSAGTARPWPAGGDDGTVRLWDVATRRQIGGPLTARQLDVPARVLRGGVQPGRQDPGQLAATMARCGCGTWPPAGRSAPAHRRRGRRGLLGGVQPGRQDPGQRRFEGTVRLWDVATRRQSAARSPATGPVLAVAFSPDGTTLAAAATMARCGCGTWPPSRQSAARSPAPPALGPLGGVQPGRHDPGHRRRRWHGAAVGRGHPPADRPPHRPHGRRSARWRSARTARPWPPAAPMARVRLWNVAYLDRHRAATVCIGRTVPDTNRMGTIRARHGIPKHLPVKTESAAS